MSKVLLDCTKCGQNNWSYYTSSSTGKISSYIKRKYNTNKTILNVNKRKKSNAKIY